MNPRGPAHRPSGAALLDAFLDTWKHAVLLARGHAETVAVVFDGRRLRSLWLQHLSRSADELLRSPVFLELAQHQIRRLNTWSRLAPKSQPDRRPTP